MVEVPITLRFVPDEVVVGAEMEIGVYDFDQQEVNEVQNVDVGQPDVPVIMSVDRGTWRVLDQIEQLARRQGCPEDPAYSREVRA